ncbi:MAG TPA: hypothetical protein VMU99_03290 [Acidimicrobiales bacterium]|nr:hypothetical protein [Acidimicrobiales bacterium]
MRFVSTWGQALQSFWWDLPVGDTPELSVGVISTLGAAFLFRLKRTLAVDPVLFVAIFVLIVSMTRGRQRA